MRLASYNTAYTAHFVRTNFGYAETSYMLGTLYEIMEEEHLVVQRRTIPLKRKRVYVWCDQSKIGEIL